MTKMIQLTDKDVHDKLNEDFVIIDVRGPDEHAKEHIPGSINIPVDQLQKTDWSSFKDKTLLVHCRSGNRTTMAQPIIETIPAKRIYCLSGGIEQWKRCAQETVCDPKAPLPIMQQVQIVVGILIVAGVILAILISPYFLLLDLFVGLGLLLAGITGFCGMARVLMLLPYNKH